jgi:hypothetical protein
MNNYDKTFVYDERPGFEAYNAVNMQYPNMPVMPMMVPNMGFNNTSNNQTNSYNNLESRVSNLEKSVQNLENKIQKLEGNIYPAAVDYTSMSSDYISSSYQNSMNIM